MARLYTIRPHSCLGGRSEYVLDLSLKDVVFQALMRIRNHIHLQKSRSPSIPLYFSNSSSSVRTQITFENIFDVLAPLKILLCGITDHLLKTLFVINIAILMITMLCHSFICWLLYDVYLNFSTCKQVSPRYVIFLSSVTSSSPRFCPQTQGLAVVCRNLSCSRMFALQLL